MVRAFKGAVAGNTCRAHRRLRHRRGRQRGETEMKLRSALLAATVLALPIAAQAQPVTGLYVGAGAGINWNLQENLKNLSFPAVAPLHSGVATSGNLKSSVGVGTAVSLGGGFGNGLRAEVQGAYMWNHISGFTNTGLVGGGTNEQKYG